MGLESVNTFIIFSKTRRIKNDSTHCTSSLFHILLKQCGGECTVTHLSQISLLLKSHEQHNDISENVILLAEIKFTDKNPSHKRLTLD